MAELIKEALSISPEFRAKMAYWIHNRKRQPDEKWVLEQLAKALGEERVVEFLKELSET